MSMNLSLSSIAAAWTAASFILPRAAPLLLPLGLLLLPAFVLPARRLSARSSVINDKARRRSVRPSLSFVASSLKVRFIASRSATALLSYFSLRFFFEREMSLLVLVTDDTPWRGV